MKRLVAIGLLVTTCALGACKEDPPPPPLPEPKPSAASRSKRARPITPDLKTAQVPNVSDESMKRFRVELCRYGVYGLLHARDAYLQSLAGAEPSDKKLPSFGELPASQTKAPPSAAPLPGAGATATAGPPSAAPRPGAGTAAGAKPPTAPKPGAKPAAGAKAAGSARPGGATIGESNPRLRGIGSHGVMAQAQLPFARHVRSCAIAKTTKQPADEALDAALGEFDAFAAPLVRHMMDANRYYARKQYEHDKFARGKKIHSELTAAFKELDAKVAAVVKASDAWLGSLGPAKEKLDEGGKVAGRLVDEARALAKLVLGDEVTAAALEAGVEKVRTELAALEAEGKKDPKSAFARSMPPSVRELIDAASKVEIKQKKASVASRYLVSHVLCKVLEASHRALGQMLRQRGDTKAGGPMRLMRPRMRATSDKPELRARPKPAGE